jgi:hypothetical protein
MDTLNEDGSNWDLDSKDDSKVWADLELLQEKADELVKLDEEVMNLLLQVEAGEEELDKEMQRADEYAIKYCSEGLRKLFDLRDFILLYLW